MLFQDLSGHAAPQLPICCFSSKCWYFTTPLCIISGISSSSIVEFVTLFFFVFFRLFILHSVIHVCSKFSRHSYVLMCARNSYCLFLIVSIRFLFYLNILIAHLLCPSGKSRLCLFQTPLHLWGEKLHIGSSLVSLLITTFSQLLITFFF